ncbi:MAG TPA: DUF2950 family protein [Planctomycetota bacterium]|nr:DUF2950 family protein [Planctomycetota bacterium]
MRPSTFWSLLGAGSLILLFAGFTGGFSAFFDSRPHGSVERPACTYLKTITSAQADFRANDRDRDGVNQFWRADIAGLYALAPGGGPAIRLIERRLAMADARPVYEIGAEGERAPLKGYWFRAIRNADETTVDASTRFAAVAYPAEYPKTGRYTFIVNENNTIFRADLGHGKGVDFFPTDELLRTSWAKLD